MTGLQQVVNVLLGILNLNFVVLGVRLNLTIIIIGGFLLSIAGYFVFGIFDDD